MKRKCRNNTQTWHFLLSLEKEVEEEDTTLRKEVTKVSILEVGILDLLEKEHIIRIIKVIKIEIRIKGRMELSHVKFLVGTTTLLLSVFAGEITLIRLQMNFQKH